MYTYVGMMWGLKKLDRSFNDGRWMGHVDIGHCHMVTHVAVHNHADQIEMVKPPEKHNIHLSQFQTSNVIFYIYLCIFMPMLYVCRQNS